MKVETGCRRGDDLRAVVCVASTEAVLGGGQYHMEAGWNVYSCTYFTESAVSWWG